VTYADLYREHAALLRRRDCSDCDWTTEDAARLAEIQPQIDAAAGSMAAFEHLVADRCYDAAGWYLWARGVSLAELHAPP
jgi:hypothetical protein